MCATHGLFCFSFIHTRVLHALQFFFFFLRIQSSREVFLGKIFCVLRSVSQRRQQVTEILCVFPETIRVDFSSRARSFLVVARIMLPRSSSFVLNCFHRKTSVLRLRLPVVMYRQHVCTRAPSQLALLVANGKPSNGTSR